MTKSSGPKIRCLGCNDSWKRTSYCPCCTFDGKTLTLKTICWQPWSPLACCSWAVARLWAEFGSPVGIFARRLQQKALARLARALEMSNVFRLRCPAAQGRLHCCSNRPKAAPLTSPVLRDCSRRPGNEPGLRGEEQPHILRAASADGGEGGSFC